MIKILFICHGNICRSPMAEFMLKDMVEKLNIKDEFYIQSAATSTEEIINGIGSAVYPSAREELALHGISCEGKHAVQINISDYNKYDYIICMERINVRNALRILKSDPQNKIKLILDFTDNPRDVADPYYTGDFSKTYEDILAGLKGLLNYLGY